MSIQSKTTSILEISSRTVQKIIARANLKCSLCNWNEATGDIHHIVETNQGGTDSMDNLIYLCPNCHRCVHQLGEKFKTKEELLQLSLSKTFSNWLDFYNIRINKKIELKNTKSLYTKLCMECNTLIPHHRIFCSVSCGSKYHNKERFKPNKYSKEILIEILTKHNGLLTRCGAELEISDNAFRKQCIKFNINFNEYRKTYKRKKVINLYSAAVGNEPNKIVILH